MIGFAVSRSFHHEEREGVPSICPGLPFSMEHYQEDCVPDVQIVLFGSIFRALFAAVAVVCVIGVQNLVALVRDVDHRLPKKQKTFLLDLSSSSFCPILFTAARTDGHAQEPVQGTRCGEHLLIPPCLAS